MSEQVRRATRGAQFHAVLIDDESVSPPHLPMRSDLESESLGQQHAEHELQFARRCLRRRESYDIEPVGIDPRRPAGHRVILNLPCGGNQHPQRHGGLELRLLGGRAGARQHEDQARSKAAEGATSWPHCGQ